MEYLVALIPTDDNQTDAQFFPRAEWQDAWELLCEIVKEFTEKFPAEPRKPGPYTTDAIDGYYVQIWTVGRPETKN